MNVSHFVSSNKQEIISYLLKNSPKIEDSFIIIFGSKEFLNDLDINEILKNNFTSVPIVGCSTAGEIVGKQIKDNSFVLTRVQLAKTRVKKISIQVQKTEDSFNVGQNLVNVLMADDLKHVLVFSDGSIINGSRLVEGINSSTQHKITVSGGLAADGTDFNSTLVCSDDNIFKSNVVTAIGFYGHEIKFKCSSFGGWNSFGLEREITKSKENVVYEIDGKPALDLYKTYLGDKANDLPASALLFPISMKESDNHEPLVRTILGVDKEENSLRFAGNIPVGAKVRLMRASNNSLLNAAEIAAQMSRFDDMDNAKNGLIIMVSCVGRKLVLKQLAEYEVESVVSHFNDTFKSTGFYSYGEISSRQDNAVTLYNSTASSSLIDAMYSGYSPCMFHNQTMTITAMIED